MCSIVLPFSVALRVVKIHMFKSLWVKPASYLRKVLRKDFRRPRKVLRKVLRRVLRKVLRRAPRKVLRKPPRKVLRKGPRKVFRKAPQDRQGPIHVST